MVRVTSTYTFNAGSDGAIDEKFTIDLASMLSEKYGRLIRQGQVFKVTGVDVRAFNPDTAVQDSVSACSGNLYYYHPTGNRKTAWKAAFKAVQELRRAHGLKEQHYDFRVGVHPLYGGVAQQAWIRGESHVLTLSGPDDDRNSIFSVHNAGLVQEMVPVDPDMNGFGTPYDTSGITEGDLDFKEDGYGTFPQDSPFFLPGSASHTADVIPFTASATGLIDFDAVNEDEYFGPSWTLTEQNLDSPVMCGLLGVHVDSTVTDDLLNQDVGIQITVEVESWSPILRRRR